MGFWGTVVGSLYDAAVPGVVIAARLLDLLGGDELQAAGGLPTLPMELSWEDDQDGRALLLQPRFPLAGVAAFRVDLMNPETGYFVKGRAPYRDDDGDFFVMAIADPAAGLARCYAPLGAARVSSAARFMLRVLTLSNESILGVSAFETEWPRGQFSRSRLLRPIVQLAMQVAYADGQLDRSEVRCIRRTLVEAFELEKGDQDDLRELMKAKSTGTVEEQVSHVLRRMPGVDPLVFLRLLADVAHADGSIHPREVEVVRDAALAMGLDADAWPAKAAELGLVSQQAVLGAAYAAFDLGPDASLAQVKAAYRAKMRDYHPDKVAHLPVEFQEVAHRRSQELNEAYATLHEALGDST